LKINSDLYKFDYNTNNDIWVACSNKGLYYSTDGKTWTQSNITDGYFYSVYGGKSIKKFKTIETE